MQLEIKAHIKSAIHFASDSIHKFAKKNPILTFHILLLALIFELRILTFAYAHVQEFQHWYATIPYLEDLFRVLNFIQ